MLKDSLSDEIPYHNADYPVIYDMKGAGAAPFSSGSRIGFFLTLGFLGGKNGFGLSF